MTDAEMAEAVGLARAFDDANSNTMKMGHALTIARALIESRRQVEALTSVLDAIAAAVDAFEGNQPPQYAPGEYDHAALAKTAASVIRDDSTSALGLADRLRAERAAATARAERAEAKLAGQCETCGGEGVMYVEPVNGRGGEECVACGECLGSTRGWVAQAIAGKVTTERARVVEAIAAWLEKTGNLVANTLSPDDDRETCMDVNTEAQTWEQAAVAVRATNWAPPEEDGNE